MIGSGTRAARRARTRRLSEHRKILTNCLCQAFQGRYRTVIQFQVVPQLSCQSVARAPGTWLHSRVWTGIVAQEPETLERKVIAPCPFDGVRDGEAGGRTLRVQSRQCFIQQVSQIVGDQRDPVEIAR